MKPRPITVDELFEFAIRNSGRKFKTLAQRKNFTITADIDYIRFFKDSGYYDPVNREKVAKYIAIYNKVPTAITKRTAQYPSKWRERSYMVKILNEARAEIEARKSSLANGSKTASMKRVRLNWTRDQLLVALNLYHKLNFGQFTARNPVIMAVANKLGREPGGLSMKLCNFASFDPALKMRGIKGLSGASKLDKSIWDEFHANLPESAPASEQAFQKLFGPEDGDGVEVLPKKGVRLRQQPTGSTDRWSNTKQRRGQEFFRDAVLNNFGGCCGITGLAVRELLVASHILPWGKYEAERLNVRNGLALTRLHDAAFDVGLITFDPSLRLKLSKELKSYLPQRAVAECFAAYDGEPLRLPEDAALPDEKFLAVHRAKSLERWS